MAAISPLFSEEQQFILPDFNLPILPPIGGGATATPGFTSPKTAAEQQAAAEFFCTKRKSH